MADIIVAWLLISVFAVYVAVEARRHHLAWKRRRVHAQAQKLRAAQRHVRDVEYVRRVKAQARRDGAL